MHAHIAGSAELRERFKREARVAAQVEREGDILRPYPACDCWFGAAAFDREHGKK